MDMSKLELTTRSNYLIYNYMKKQLGNNELAEHFRKFIQQSAHKDIIKFKGLEDLVTVLKNYYSSPAAATAQVDTNSQLPSAKEAGTVQHDEAEMPPADCNGGGSESTQVKKKKKNKNRKSEPVAEPEAAPVAPVMEQQEEEPVEEEKRTKKKKKKRQLDAEQSEDAAPANGDEPEQQEAEADAAAPPMETEAEAESQAPKSKKRKKQRRNTEEAAVSGDSNKIVDEEHSQQDVNGDVDVENGKPEAELEEKQTEADVELNGSKSGKSKRHNQPFRRVREEEVVNKHFQDNSFDAKPGASAGWGYKANEDLKPTQGRSFRHEKTKKKRGSYKGGAIDTGVSSFKFGSDSE